MFTTLIDCLSKKRNLSNYLFLSVLTLSFLTSCSSDRSKNVNGSNNGHDSVTTAINNPTQKKDTIVQNGEYTKYYANGAVEIQGIMKNGKREGNWKSFYDNGDIWSEMEYSNGKKNGLSSAWYPNKIKRYEGSYTHDAESGKWTFWDENGKVQSTHTY